MSVSYVTVQTWLDGRGLLLFSCQCRKQGQSLHVLHLYVDAKKHTHLQKEFIYLFLNPPSIHQHAYHFILTENQSWTIANQLFLLFPQTQQLCFFFKNGWHPDCWVQASAGWQGTAGMYCSIERSIELKKKLIGMCKHEGKYVSSRWSVLYICCTHSYCASWLHSTIWVIHLTNLQDHFGHRVDAVTGWSLQVIGLGHVGV